jgi:peptidoglycan/LPS O-acetylase OafA/YrhL
MVICNPIVLEFAFGALIAIVYFRSEAKPLRSPSSRIGWLLIVPGTLCGIVLGVTKPDWIAPFQNQILAGYGVMARVLTWGIACALVVAGVVFLAPSLKSRVGRIMLAIGNASYSTYLLSGMAVANMSRPFADFGKLHPTHSLPVLSVIQILIVTALTCVGLVLYQFIERPLIRRTYHLIARRDV